jgi:uncharacterized protein YxjI
MEHVLLDVKTNWEINHPKRRGILELKKRLLIAVLRPTWRVKILHLEVLTYNSKQQN